MLLPRNNRQRYADGTHHVKMWFGVAQSLSKRLMETLQQAIAKQGEDSAAGAFARGIVFEISGYFARGLAAARLRSDKWFHAKARSRRT